MANEYATLDEVKTRILNKTVTADEGELDRLREAASRAIDDYLEVYTGYFSPPGAATVKILRGTGESFIILPAPLSGAVTVTADTDLEVPDFTVDGLRLRTLNSQGLPTELIAWGAGQFYTVTGLWGYTVIPPQIKEACLQLVVHFWRGRDKALTGTITDMRTDEQFPERDYPRMTRRILDSFKYALGEKPGGGLVLA